MSGILDAAAGVLIFLSMDHWLHLNGYAKYSLIISLIGIGFIVWTDHLKTRLFSESLITTVAAILVFIGLYTTFSAHIDTYWLLYLIVGIGLLNSREFIERKLR